MSFFKSLVPASFVVNKVVDKLETYTHSKAPVSADTRKSLGREVDEIVDRLPGVTAELTTALPKLPSTATMKKDKELASAASHFAERVAQLAPEQFRGQLERARNSGTNALSDADVSTQYNDFVKLVVPNLEDPKIRAAIKEALLAFCQDNGITAEELARFEGHLIELPALLAAIGPDDSLAKKLTAVEGILGKLLHSASA